MARPPSRRKDRGGMLKTLLANTSLLVDGVSYGMVLFLMSVGLTVTLGVMRVANLAHCGFAMVGGYVALWLMTQLQVGFAVALVAGTALVVVASGFVLERNALPLDLFDAAARPDPDDHRPRVRHGRKRQPRVWVFDLFPRHSELAAWALGRRRRSLCRATAPSSLLVLGLCILACCFRAILECTTFGALPVRASVDNPRMARTIGVDVPHVFAVTFAIGLRPCRDRRHCRHTPAAARALLCSAPARAGADGDRRRRAGQPHRLARWSAASGDHRYLRTLLHADGGSVRDLFRCRRHPAAAAARPVGRRLTDGTRARRLRPPLLAPHVLVGGSTCSRLRSSS